MFGFIYLLFRAIAQIAAGASNLRREGRTKNESPAWPSVEGRIVMAKVARAPKTLHYIAILDYSYFVGEYRTGEHTQNFSKEDEACDFARQIRDKQLQVRYMPRNPNVSALDQSSIDRFLQPTLRAG